MTLTYRTNDFGKWGYGKGSSLSSAEGDNNIYEIKEVKDRVTVLEGAGVGVGIDYLETVGAQFYVHLTDHGVLGPYDMPSSRWTWRDEWHTLTAYSVNDILSENGSLYLVPFAHVSDFTTFDPGANDGLGHDYYILVLTAPGSVIPVGGESGQVLTKHSASDLDIEWITPYYVPTGGDSGDILIKHSSSDGDAIWQQEIPPSQLVPLVVQDVTQSGANINIDHSLGEICVLSLTADITSIAVSNWFDSGLQSKIILEISNTGAYGITGWPSGTIWGRGTPPTITSGTGKIDRIVLSTRDGGTTIFGDVIGQDYN